jgi:hypothetical protein
MNKYAIWWLSQAACEEIEPIIDEIGLPDYIRAEFQSRLGRAGRGRLWVADGIDLSEIEWQAEKPAAKLAGKCGGIVIRSEDVGRVLGLPGFVTDTDLEFWGGVDA